MPASMRSHRTTNLAKTAAAVVALAAAGLVHGDGGGGGSFFDDCGTLHVFSAPAGIQCASFETHTGGLYQLDHTGGFGDGDAVCVTGIVSGCGGSVCGTFSGCVAVSSIDADSGPLGSGVVTIDLCAVISETLDTCITILDPTGTLYGVSIGRHSFEEGQTIRVVGLVGPCADACVQGVPCIANPYVLSCPIQGDLNQDDTVNGLDLAAMLAVWGPCQGCAADLDGNDAVNGLDLALLLSHWG
jgi:hypothetical protein